MELFIIATTFFHALQVGDTLVAAGQDVVLSRVEFHSIFKTERQASAVILAVP